MKLSFLILFLFLYSFAYSQSESSVEYQSGTTLEVDGDATYLVDALSGDGTILGEYRIIIGGTPLPVEIVSILAKYVMNSVILEWQTANEVNNYGFEVERTSPRPSPLEGEGGEAGRGWHIIGFVQGYGNSNAVKTYTFTDNNPPVGKVQYRLKQIDNDGSSKYSDVIEVNVKAPAVTELLQNYPNPFNPVTAIRYNLSEDNFVILKVYDIAGREVETLVNEQQPAGRYEVKFDGSKYPSGVYLYKLKSNNLIQTKKFILTK